MRYPREIQTDFLVIGGGLGGICAAIQAARLGAAVVLIEKDTMLGGNSGPNGAVHPSGAHRFHTYSAETGIIEEIVENAAWVGAKTASLHRHYNSSKLWDQVLYDMLVESGVTVLRSNYAREPVLSGRRIIAVKVEDTGTFLSRTIYVKHGVIDASGDGHISAAAGAEFRMGQEGKNEFGERTAPDTATSITMGSSVVAIVRKTSRPVSFIPPPGTPSFFPGYGDYPWFDPAPDDDLFYFFPTETGGQLDTILDEDEIYNTALKLLYSAWDYVKNDKYIEKAKNWELLWVSPKLLKRESRRFIGDYILNQNDVESGKVFPDAIAYGGFAEDLHHPREEMPAYVKIVYQGIPPIYTIPYRCIYSRNIDNILFACRAISVTHIAHGTTRLQRTCAAIGQAAGCAAALIKKYETTPRDIGQHHIKELQQLLVREDGSVPGITNADTADIARQATVFASSERKMCAELPARWIRMDKPMGVMLWDFPAYLQNISFLLNNTGGSPVSITAILRERAYPQGWQIKEVGSVQKGFSYEKVRNEVEWADNSDLDIFNTVKEVTVTLPVGKNTVVFPFETKLLAKKATVDEERYVVEIQAPDTVKMAINGRFCDYARRVEKSEEAYIDYGDIPVFTMSPSLPYGEAANVIDGVNRRFSNNPIHMWQADAPGTIPQVLTMKWEGGVEFSSVHIAFDSIMRAYIEMPFDCGKRVSERLVRDYKIDALTDGGWQTLADVTDNYHRFRRHNFDMVKADKLRIIIKRMWDETSPARIYEVRVY